MPEDLKRIIEEQNEETRRHFDTVAERLRDENAETRRHFDTVAERLRDENAETRRHFDTVAEHLVGRIELVAEGVLANSEKIERVNEELTAFRSDVKGEFVEVRSMIKLSYSELDRRLSTLESDVSSLAERVGRLESQSAS